MCLKPPLPRCVWMDEQPEPRHRGPVPRPRVRTKPPPAHGVQDTPRALCMHAARGIAGSPGLGEVGPAGTATFEKQKPRPREGA